MTPRSPRRLLVIVVLLVGLAAGPGGALADNFAEFIGRSDQNGSAITHYGYFTHLRGVPDADLFFDPATRTEATARITYFATTTLNTRHVLGNVITTATAPGTITFYLRESPGATFASPASFAVGASLGAVTVRYHNVLIVQGPNELGQQVGIASATADGAGAVRFRITASGSGTLLVNDPAQFVSRFLLGGNIVTEP